MTLKPNATLTRAQVSGIVAFVSKAVEGLAPENVTVVDNKGNLISEPGGPEAGAVSSQLDYRRAVEGYLAEKAQAILIPALGAGRAVVKVTADINFQRLKEVRDTINPDQKALKTEKTTSRTTQSSGGGARGVAGAASNLALRQTGAVAAAGGSSTSTSKEEESESTFDYSRTRVELEDKLGGINRLTVAATVDLTAPEGGQPPLTKQAAESLIRQAIGFDEARGDAIQVVEAKLAAGAPAATAPTEPPAEADSVLARLDPERGERLRADMRRFQQAPPPPGVLDQILDDLDQILREQTAPAGSAPPAAPRRPSPPRSGRPSRPPPRKAGSRGRPRRRPTMGCPTSR